MIITIIRTDPTTDTKLGLNRQGLTVYQTPDNHRYWFEDDYRSATVHWPSVIDPTNATTRMILASYFTTQELAA